MWHVILPTDVQQDVWALAPADRDALLALVDRLRRDPFAATTPYGEDTKPVSMRCAGSGNILAVVLVNELTERVTFMRITAVE